MSEFKPGEIVDITIKGVRIVADHATYVVICDEHGVNYAIPSQAAITRVAPAEWPPQPGDVWRDTRGDVWFAADVHAVDETTKEEIVLIFSREDYRQTPEKVNQHDGPLTLVHREQDEPPPYADDHYLSCVDPDCSCKADGGEAE